MSVDVLRLRISMPNAHFRIIHSKDPLKTYPVPPYSTVIGFLANILGDKEQIGRMLADDLVLGVLSQHNYITCEYTWLRNLCRSQHIRRYGSASNRVWQEVTEHIGGQSPVSVEVLNDVHLVLYVHHPDSALLDLLQENMNAPEKWYNHLHLGRAEDWAIIDSASVISLNISNSSTDLRNANQYFQWMPEPSVAFGLGGYIDEGHYRELYQKIQGPAMLVTSVYNLVQVPYTGKKGRKVEVISQTIRNFKHIPARLSCSPIPFLDDFTLPAVFADKELNVPVYLANIQTMLDRQGGDDFAN